MKIFRAGSRIVSIILCALMLVSLIPVSAKADTGSVAGFSITSDKTELYADETLKVTLNLNCGNSGVSLFQTAVSYDTEKLELKSAEVPAGFSGYSPTVNPNYPGVVYINWDTASSPLTGSIELLHMEFIPINGAEGETSIGFSETDEHIMADGSFKEIEFNSSPCTVKVKPETRPEEEPENTEEITAFYLDKTYILMQEGNEQSVTVSASVLPGKYQKNISWALSDDRVVRAVVKDNVCTVSPISAGTAFITASATDGAGKKISTRCRIDVAKQNSEQEVQASLTLKSTAAAVELYSKDYARIEVLPSLYQYGAGTATGNSSTSGSGLAISSAEFTDATLAEYFTLEVVDDHTLEIRPTSEAVSFGLAKAANLKGNFSTAIKAVIGGKTVTTSSKIKITVKKSIPVVKCSAVKINSYAGSKGTAELSFTVNNKPVKLKNLQLNSKIAAPKPDWLTFNKDELLIAYSGTNNKNISGKLYLTGELDNWVDEVSNVAIVVSVSASSTAPKITCKPTTAFVGADSCDASEIICSVTTPGFDAKDISIEKLTEGSGKTLVSCEYGSEEFSERLNAVIKDGTARISSNDKSGKSRTYKLYLKISDKLYTVNVKTALPTMTVKLSGAIDTVLDGSPITVTPGFGNISDSKCVQSYDYLVTTSDKLMEDVTDRFIFNQESMELTADINNMPVKGTYLLTLLADVGGSRLVEAKPVKFTVKTSAKKPAASVSFKAGGAIDVLRPSTSVVLTPTVKNCYTVKLDPDSISFYSLANRVYSRVENPGFIIKQSADGRSFTLESDGTLTPGKYYVGLTGEKYDEIGAKPVYAAFMVKKGTASVKMSPNSVTLSKTDRYDYYPVLFYTTDKTLGNITRVELASGSDMFRIESFDTGRWIIGYAEFDGVPKIADSIIRGKTKSATIKLNVYFEGSDAPAATVSLKVSVK